MSTRTYNFRTRTETGGLAPSRMPVTIMERPQLLASRTRDPPPHISSSAHDTDSPPALYSHVVVSRPPSPRKETEASAAQSTASNPIGSGETVAVSPVPEIIDTTSSSEDEPPEIKENIMPWTTVKRRRARSLGSLSEGRTSKRGGATPNRELTREQVQAVKTAATNLTTPQKEVLRRRQKKVPVRKNSPTPSRREGTSKRKGKGIDPQEWGNVNISSESLDVDAQAMALESIALQREPSETQSRHAPKKGKGRFVPTRELPAESRPVAQIALNSYLGTALQNVGMSSTFSDSRRGGPPTSPGASPSEDGSPSDGGGEESSSSSSYSSHHRRRRDNRHGRHRRRHSKSSSGSRRRTLIKPIAPKEYDGQADARAYHWFVQESEAYLRDRKVKGRRQVFLLSYYLSGKAYDFYTQKVSSNEEEWTLRMFYDELFNYCFPINYRMQLRKNLA